jgi:hypothetical protein
VPSRWQIGFSYRRLVSNEFFVGTAEHPELAPGGQSPVFKIHTLVTNIGYSLSDRWRFSLSVLVSHGIAQRSISLASEPREKPFRATDQRREWWWLREVSRVRQLLASSMTRCGVAAALLALAASAVRRCPCVGVRLPRAFHVLPRLAAIARRCSTRTRSRHSNECNTISMGRAGRSARRYFSFPVRVVAFA